MEVGRRAHKEQTSREQALSNVMSDNNLDDPIEAEFSNLNNIRVLRSYGIEFAFLSPESHMKDVDYYDYIMI